MVDPQIWGNNGRSPHVRRNRSGYALHPDDARSISAVRRNQLHPVEVFLVLGSISARAEENLGTRQPLGSPWVNLRACGGTMTLARSWVWVRGRSPRVRRNPQDALRGSGRGGSISARAEEHFDCPATASSRTADLRDYGGTALNTFVAPMIWGRSPRVRRNLGDFFMPFPILRSISARAEKPRSWPWLL